MLSDGSIIRNESMVIAIRFALAEEFMIAVGYINIINRLDTLPIAYYLFHPNQPMANNQRHCQLMSGKR